MGARTLSVLIVFAGSCGLFGAQGFYGGGVSARSAARAGIYAPTSDNVVDALASNPAGLGFLNAPIVDVSVTGVLARGSFSNSVNTDSPMRRNTGAVPFGAIGTPIRHSRWSVGAAFMPDLMSSAKWRYTDAPGVAGTSYGLQNETSRILAFRSSAGVGFTVNQNLYLGAAIGAVYNSNTLDAPYIFQSNPALNGLKTLLDLRTTGVGWNGSFGMFAKPTHALDIGASYRTSTSIVSTGQASGNMGVQFAALGIPFRPDFAYQAQVKVKLPQSASMNALWQVNPAWRLSLQGDWTDWKGAFNNLPVLLTQGTNSDINSFLNSSSIKDVVPLDWKDQFTIRGGVERRFGEKVSLSGGYLHTNNPVPGSTLSPLTAAIMQNALTTGLGYQFGRTRLDFAYSVDLNAQEQVGTSALLSGEYSNSRTKIGTQMLTLSASFRL